MELEFLKKEEERLNSEALRIRNLQEKLSNQIKKKQDRLVDIESQEL